MKSDWVTTRGRNSNLNLAQLADLFHDPFGDIIDGGNDLRRHGCTGVEAGAFYRIDDDGLRETMQFPSERNGLGEAESVARRQRSGLCQRRIRCFKPVDPTRLSHRVGRVDAYERIKARPIFHEGDHVTAVHCQRYIHRQVSHEPPSDQHTHAIIGSVWVPDSEDHGLPLPRIAHDRRTFSFRKCAEQEIQGS